MPKFLGVLSLRNYLVDNLQEMTTMHDPDLPSYWPGTTTTIVLENQSRSMDLPRVERPRCQAVYDDDAPPEKKGVHDSHRCEYGQSQHRRAIPPNKLSVDRHIDKDID